MLLGVLSGAIKARKKSDEGQEMNIKSCYLTMFLSCKEIFHGCPYEALQLCSILKCAVLGRAA